MIATIASKANLRSITGAAFLAGGAALMVSQLGLLAFQIRTFLNNSLLDSLGSGAGLGLASLHVLQSAAFNHTVLFSFAYKILVSFTAFGIIVAGLALQRRQSGKANSQNRPHAPTSVKGD
jgi:hypothetical protein